MKIGQLNGVTENTDQALRALALAEFEKAFALAGYAEFYEMRGNADSPRKVDATMTAGANRTISTGYTAKTNTPGFGAMVLKIYGDLVQTDIAYERRGIDIGSQRARDLANFARSLGRYFMDCVINDSLSATKFSGLLEQTTALSLKTVFDTSAGGSLPAGNAAADIKQQAKFMELLNKWIGLVKPSCIIANADFISRLESIGRNYITTTNVSDIYGANQVVTNYKNVPLVDAGYAANNSGYVIPVTETEGGSSDCTSIYLPRFGEEIDVTFATNVGIDVKNLKQVGTTYQTMFEFDVDLGVLDTTALRRISGIRLSAA